MGDEESKSAPSSILKEIALAGIRADVQQITKGENLDEVMLSDLRLAVDGGASIEEILDALFEAVPEELRPEIYCELVDKARVSPEDLERIKKLWNLK